MKNILIILAILTIFVSCKEKSIEENGGMNIVLNFDKNYSDTANLKTVINKRLKTYNLSNYSIIINNNNIYIDIPEFTDSSIINDLLCKRGYFETKETYENPEILPYLLKLNNQILLNDTSIPDTIKYPLFMLLAPNTDENMQALDGVNSGYVKSKDTIKVTDYLRQYSNIFPSNIQFAWSIQYKTDDIYILIPIKGTKNGIAPITGEMIETAKAEASSYNNSYVISAVFKEKYHKVWADLTRKNINKVLTLIIDNKVYSTPYVNSEIKNGNTQLSGDFSKKEAMKIAAYMNSGALPCKIRVNKIEVIKPKETE